MSQECGQTLEGKKMDSPLERLERNAGSSLMRPIFDFWPLDLEDNRFILF